MDTFTKIATRIISKIFLVTAEVPWAILLQLFSLKLWSFCRNIFQSSSEKSSDKIEPSFGGDHLAAKERLSLRNGKEQ